MRLALAACAAVLTLAVVPGGSVAAQTVRAVAVKDGSPEFQPQTIAATQGDDVFWSNQGSMQHSVTADNGAFDQTLCPATDNSCPTTFTLRVNAVGSFPYHCKFHPDQKGVLTVSKAEATTTTAPPAATTTTAAGPVPIPATTTTAPKGATPTSVPILTPLAPLATTTTSEVTTTTSGPPEQAQGETKSKSSRAPWVAGASVLLGLSAFGTLLTWRRFAG